MSNRWARLAPFTGVIAAVLIAVAIGVSFNQPGADATGAKVISYYKDHHGIQMAGAALGAIGLVVYVFFAGTLRGHLQARTPDLARISFGGALINAAGTAIFVASTFALADVPDKLDPAAAQALNVIGNDFFFPSAIGGAIFMIATGRAIIRGRSLPVWLGWVSLVIGVGAMTPAGQFAFFAFIPWLVVTAVLLYLRGGSAAVTASAA